MNLIYLMYHSGFPCFKVKSMKELEKRFKLNLSSYEAARYMRDLIYDADNKLTTVIYDQIQFIQNKIAY